jgi:amphi-Trp domain-containing protein
LRAHRGGGSRIVLRHFVSRTRNASSPFAPGNKRRQPLSTASPKKRDRDIEKDYPLPQFIDKLRRLADALEKGERFEIQIANERISVPVRAQYNIEHERGDGEEEIEFQIKWQRG